MTVSPIVSEPSGLLKELAEQCVADTDRWFGDKDVNNLPFMVLALCGETGELANLIKKVERGSLPFEEAVEDIREETVDVFTYLLNVAGLLGMDLEHAYRMKRYRNETRFGGK